MALHACSDVAHAAHVAPTRATAVCALEPCVLERFVVCWPRCCEITFGIVCEDEDRLREPLG